MFHTNPNILHYKNNESNGIMKEGHTFTIEPMICEGTGETIHRLTAPGSASRLAAVRATQAAPALKNLSDKKISTIC